MKTLRWRNGGSINGQEGREEAQLDANLLDALKIHEELWLGKKNIKIHRAFLEFWQCFEERQMKEDIHIRKKKNNMNW